MYHSIDTDYDRVTPAEGDVVVYHADRALGHDTFVVPPVGGTVRVCRQRNAGTRFRFKLPEFALGAMRFARLGEPVVHADETVVGRTYGCYADYQRVR